MPFQFENFSVRAIVREAASIQRGLGLLRADPRLCIGARSGLVGRAFGARRPSVSVGKSDDRLMPRKTSRQNALQAPVTTATVDMDLFTCPRHVGQVRLTETACAAMWRSGSTAPVWEATKRVCHGCEIGRAGAGVAALDAPPSRAYPSHIAPHRAIGFDSPEKRRTRRHPCGFFCARRLPPSFMGGSGGEPSGSPVPFPGLSTRLTARPRLTAWRAETKTA